MDVGGSAHSIRVQDPSDQAFRIGLNTLLRNLLQKMKERTHDNSLLLNLLKSLDSIGQGRMRTQV
jgi:hypothetical protein